MIGYQFAFGKSGAGLLKHSGELSEAIAAGRNIPKITFWQKFIHMFTVDMPASIESALTSQALSEWKQLWETPIFLSLIVMVIFALTFRDRNKLN